MIKTLARHGNSLALVIDRAVLDLLNIDSETPLEISTDGQVLVITPVHDPERRKQIETAFGSVNRRIGARAVNGGSGTLGHQKRNDGKTEGD